MRSTFLGIGLLVLSSSVSAQTPCGPLTLGFDPYSPSDAAVLRQYGGAVMAQVPLSTLLRLDPYVPAQAELLRQVGNGMPAWMAHAWYPAAPPPSAPDCASVSEPASSAPAAASAAPLTTFAEMLTVLELRRGSVPPEAASATPRGSVADRNRGLTINFAGRAWTSAGPAVSFRGSEFVDAGNSNGFPVYRLAREKVNVIYVPTTPGMVAPFRPAIDR